MELQQFTSDTALDCPPFNLILPKLIVKTLFLSLSLSFLVRHISCYKWGREDFPCCVRLREPCGRAKACGPEPSVWLVLKGPEQRAARRPGLRTSGDCTARPSCSLPEAHTSVASALGHSCPQTCTASSSQHTGTYKHAGPGLRPPASPDPATGTRGDGPCPCRCSVSASRCSAKTEPSSPVLCSWPCSSLLRRRAGSLTSPDSAQSLSIPITEHTRRLPPTWPGRAARLCQASPRSSEQVGGRDRLRHIPAGPRSQASCLRDRGD